MLLDMLSEIYTCKEEGMAQWTESVADLLCGYSWILAGPAGSSGTEMALTLLGG